MRKMNTEPDLAPAPMIYAVQSGNADIIKRLIEEGAGLNGKVNDDGQTGLMVAAKLGNTECVKALIGAGADLDAQDNNGKTALMLVVDNSNMPAPR